MIQVSETTDHKIMVNLGGAFQVGSKEDWAELVEQLLPMIGPLPNHDDDALPVLPPDEDEVFRQMQVTMVAAALSGVLSERNRFMGANHQAEYAIQVGCLTAALLFDKQFKPDEDEEDERLEDED